MNLPRWLYPRCVLEMTRIGLLSDIPFPFQSSVILIDVVLLFVDRCINLYKYLLTSELLVISVYLLTTMDAFSYLFVNLNKLLTLYDIIVPFD